MIVALIAGLHPASVVHWPGPGRPGVLCETLIERLLIDGLGKRVRECPSLKFVTTHVADLELGILIWESQIKNVCGTARSF